MAEPGLHVDLLLADGADADVQYKVAWIASCVACHSGLESVGWVDKLLQIHLQIPADID